MLVESGSRCPTSRRPESPLNWTSSCMQITTMRAPRSVHIDPPSSALRVSCSWKYLACEPDITLIFDTYLAISYIRDIRVYIQSKPRPVLYSAAETRTCQVGVFPASALTQPAMKLIRPSTLFEKRYQAGLCFILQVSIACHRVPFHLDSGCSRYKTPTLTLSRFFSTRIQCCSTHLRVPSD